MEGRASCQDCSGSGAVTEYESGETSACRCTVDKKKSKALTLEALEPFIRKIVREEMKRCE